MCESTQLESVSAIQRLTVLGLSVAVKTLQLVEGRDNSNLSATVVFSEDQHHCLAQIAPTLQGQTQRQQNLYPIASLAWATWLIARLGGWSGYWSQKPPGVATMIQGLRQFESMFIGWKTSLGVVLCTP